MPQTDFFLECDDAERVVQYIFSRGGRLVPDFNDQATPTVIHDVVTFKQFGEQRLFFIQFDAYTRCPLELHRIEGGYYEGKYSVTQRWGGPTIDLYLPPPGVKDGVRWLRDGGISYYATYRNTVSGCDERVPEELRRIYRDIVKEIKAGARPVEGKHRKYWIGPAAYRSLRAGSKLNVAGLHVP